MKWKKRGLWNSLIQYGGGQTRRACRSAQAYPCSGDSDQRTQVYQMGWCEYLPFLIVYLHSHGWLDIHVGQASTRWPVEHKTRIRHAFFEHLCITVGSLIHWQHCYQCSYWSVTGSAPLSACNYIYFDIEHWLSFSFTNQMIRFLLCWKMLMVLARESQLCRWEPSEFQMSI